MHDLSIRLADEDSPQARLTLPLEHFLELSDEQKPGRVMQQLECGCWHLRHDPLLRRLRQHRCLG